MKADLQPEHVDFLKIDAEGWDFRVLGGYDPSASPRLVMLEFSSNFPAQSGAELERQRPSG